MKILVPITYAELGGSQVFLLKLLDAFSADKDVAFSVLAFQRGPLCDELARRNIPCRIMAYSLKRPWTLFPVISEIKKQKPDVIYLHAGRIFAGIARILGIPCVERINMSRVTAVGGWCSKPWIDRICTSLNTKALAVSSAIEKQLLARGIRQDKLIVIRNFVELDRFHHPECKNSARKTLGIPENKKLVINIGRFTEQKTQKDFIAAAAAALAKNPDFQFLLVGDGPKKQELQQQAENLGITDSVTFMPFRKDIETVYHAADFMLHTAHWAPLDNVLLEAMAAGLPVIASNADGTGEVILDQETGLLFKAGDTAAAAELLLKAAAAPDLARRLGANAYEFVCRNHSIPVVRDQFKKMFTDLAEKNK